MAIKHQSGQGIEHRSAVSQVLDFLHQTHRNGRRIYPLTEISEATSIDLTTAEAVMRELEDIGPYDVIPLETGEVRWRVEGCVYDLDGWDGTSWNLR